jgi:hypothetical protein
LAHVATPAAVKQDCARHHNSHTVKGITWRGIRREDARAVTALVRRAVPHSGNWELTPRTQGIAAHTRHGALLAVVLATEPRTASETPGLYLTVAVESNWHDAGLAMVGLNLIHRFLAGRGVRAAVLFGTCASREASLYLNAGYQVSKPHEPLLLPGSEVPMYSPKTYHPCWFFRRYE